jgi:RNA polymerase sigma factor (sigma-70 family)
MNILNDNKFLYNYAKILCSNNNLLPQELVQDTLIKVWASGKLDEKEGYYYMVLKSVFLDHCRKAKRKGAVVSILENTEREEGELKRVLDFIFNCSNSQTCKDAFLLRKFFDLEYSVIAEKMGVSEFRVRSRVFNVQSKIRKQFKRA